MNFIRVFVAIVIMANRNVSCCLLPRSKLIVTALNRVVIMKIAIATKGVEAAKSYICTPAAWGGIMSKAWR